MSLQTTILQESFQIITLQGNAFSTAFYTRLFTMHPELRPLFAHTSLEAQQEKFLMMMVLIVEQLNTPAVLESALKKLGKRHEGYGVQPEHYSLVGDTLLLVLAEFIGKNWTPAWETAWRDAYETIVGVIQGTHSLLTA